MHPEHEMHPELWFKPAPTLPLEALASLIEGRVIIATPRLGKRDETHPKGYHVGQQITLRVFDEDDRQHRQWEACVTGILARPLFQLRPEDLAKTGLCQNWHDVLDILAVYEKRAVEPDEYATIVSFELR